MGLDGPFKQQARSSVIQSPPQRAFSSFLSRCACSACLNGLSSFKRRHPLRFISLFPLYFATSGNTRIFLPLM
jgi:hypothetical protein